MTRLKGKPLYGRRLLVRPNEGRIIGHLRAGESRVPYPETRDPLPT